MTEALRFQLWFTIVHEGLYDDKIHIDNGKKFEDIYNTLKDAINDDNVDIKIHADKYTSSLYNSIIKLRLNYTLISSTLEKLLKTKYYIPTCSMSFKLDGPLYLTYTTDK
ncbi:hypothetical protein FACS189472_16630 [Alphaproteobacteria bacterium]|nr:hypothetical protein FACS189472_16630 [Alphaproteobacteria bacterium]